jgi:peptidoglycan/LPS O-acetylase OafA/YrhL
MAYIGGFSYSIYLWHVPWMLLLFKYWAFFHIRHMFILAYVAGAIVVGIVTSKLVEIPALRLRERLFEDHEQAAGKIGVTASVGETA